MCDTVSSSNRCLKIDTLIFRRSNRRTIIQGAIRSPMWNVKLLFFRNAIWARGAQGTSDASVFLIIHFTLKHNALLNCGDFPPTNRSHLASHTRWPRRRKNIPTAQRRQRKTKTADDASEVVCTPTSTSSQLLKLQLLLSRSM